jgi:DNA-binding NarL/FixJ family response regulator
MDIRMPDMDGLEATRLLRERVTGPRRPTIIAVTADPPAGDEQWYVAAGMDDILTKPLSSPRLAQILDRAGTTDDSVTSEPEAPVAAPSASESIPGPIAPIEVVVDGMLCELRVWSEQEWINLPESERPVTCVFRDGLGWVGAVPKLALN